MANRTWRELLLTCGGSEFEFELRGRAGIGLDSYMAIWQYVHR
jgi:hypothetical protein